MQLAQEVSKGLFCGWGCKLNHDKQDLANFLQPESAAGEPIMKKQGAAPGMCLAPRSFHWKSY